MVGVLAVIVDTLFFLLDAVEEKKSRSKWGGLSNGEYITHLISNTLHYCAITTVLLAKFFLDTSIIEVKLKKFEFWKFLANFGPQ